MKNQLICRRPSTPIRKGQIKTPSEAVTVSGESRSTATGWAVTDRRPATRSSGVASGFASSSSNGGYPGLVLTRLHPPSTTSCQPHSPVRTLWRLRGLTCGAPANLPGADQVTGFHEQSTKRVLT